MSNYQNEKYAVSITVDYTYTVDSADNKDYDYILNPSAKKRNDMSKTFCIEVSGQMNYRLALIGDYFSYEEDCAILEGDILTVLQNDHISMLNLKDVELILCKELDVFGTNFAIYRIENGYLIYGEIEIVKLDENLNVVWKFSGKDIFVSVSGKTAFELTNNSIKLYDFEDNYYELDFDGNLLNEIVRGRR